MNESSLRKLLGTLNTGKSVPALKLVQNDPQTAAIVSKLVQDQFARDRFDIKNESTEHAINHGQLSAISESTKTRLRDNENILKLFPDIELAVQILISSILSPKDMIKSELIYKAREPIFPAELLSNLNNIIQSHMEGFYSLQNDLQEILRDTLFATGSYVKTIIPESIVDEIINRNKTVTTESFSVDLKSLFTTDKKPRQLGFLGSNSNVAKVSTALESFLAGAKSEIHNLNPVWRQDGKADVTLEHIEVIDNFNFLKLPAVNEALIESRSKQIISQVRSTSTEFSLENYKAQNPDKKLNITELSTLMYKNNNYESRTFMAIPSADNAKRKSIGRPLVMRLPSEAVIPVYVPGDESRHIGYFVLIDADGNPVTVDSYSNASDGLSGLMNKTCANQALGNSLIEKASKNLSSNNKSPTLDNITQIYASIIETDLMKRLSNGIYGSNVKISNNDEIYRIMLSRSLASKFTRLVYLPGDLVTYFAFKYYSNGIGKSYLDDIKNLTSLRAILLFAKVMAMVKSAINLTHVNLTLDPQDPDPQKTIEIAQHEIAKMRQNYFPLGISSPVDLVDWIQKAGIEYSFEGHPGLPSTKMDFEVKNMQHTVPDSELDELLRKQTYMAFGLSPETVDNGFNSEFATTVISNNILLSRRIIQLQQTFTKDLTDYVKKVALNDVIIQEELKDIIKENKGIIEKNLTDDEKTRLQEDELAFIRDTINRFIDNIEIDLPKPDVTSLQTQSQAFDDYVEALDKVLTSWVSSEVITSDIAGDISNNIESIKNTVKHYYIRRWMAENGYMTELSDIVTANEDGNATINIYDVSKNHTEGLMKSAMNFINKMLPAKTAVNTDLQNTGTDAGSSSSGSDTGGSGDDFGADDLGGGDPFPEDTPPEETPSDTPDDETPSDAPEEKT